MKATVLISNILNASLKNGGNKKNHLSRLTTTKISNSPVSKSGLDLRRSPKVTDMSEDVDFGSNGFLGYGVVSVLKIRILQWKLAQLWIYGGSKITPGVYYLESNSK